MGACRDEHKKTDLSHLPYLLFVYPFDKLAQAFRLAPGADLSAKLLSIRDGFSMAFASPAPSLEPADLLIGIAGALILRLAVYMKGKNAKKYRHGMEYGSARWGTPADIAPYMDKDFFNNIPMTQTERITMSSRPKQPKYARNKNILVIGGSGSGKTRFFCKPSLLQAHSSYVCTDPKGTLLPEIGSFLERKKYRIKCLNLINFKKSMRYNPLAYIRSEKDILKLVNALIMNTKGEGEKSSEDFWVKAERLYYSALIGYIWYEAPEEERNFITLLDLINASEAREDDETYQSPVDILFQQLEEKEPDHFAVKQYRKFKMAAGKTLKSILISCGARLAPFDIKELRDLMETDELELDTLGDSKTALFVIISDTDSTFNFVAALMYSQLFNLLCDKADDFYGGRLPVHVRLILDEFANIGQIPNFDKLIATIRSREISASIILQSQSQLKTIYKDAADTIVGNCDSTLFLGGKEKSTLKEISELLGKETIDSYNQSENRGAQTSHGLTYQKLGKELMTQDELAVMDGGKCIFMLRGVRPFLSEKYDLTKHPNYRYTADADPKNVFDMERYMKKQ
ncbi:MAG: VirD4-like conjugal transfer protein, CD1115 family, partial [Anaerotignum lactatifermentans]|uniref:VirD4-like conjugal transfer protein, CD1115 family n=1 Tax=Anaerotignum lactatifermentans TaxID=160404 RepID=UPI00399B72AD